jgi:hypothetical protein
MHKETTVIMHIFLMLFLDRELIDNQELEEVKKKRTQ